MPDVKGGRRRLGFGLPGGFLIAAGLGCWTLYAMLFVAFQNLSALVLALVIQIGVVLILGLSHAIGLQRTNRAVFGMGAAGIALIGLWALTDASVGLTLPFDDLQFDRETAVFLLVGTGLAFSGRSVLRHAGFARDCAQCDRMVAVLLAAVLVEFALVAWINRPQPFPELFALVYEEADATALRDALAEGADVAAVVRRPGVANSMYAGQTALHQAARSRNAEAVEILVDAGAPLEAAGDRLGRTPLLYMLDRDDAHGRAYPILQILLEAGADPAARDSYGRSALHLAASHSNDQRVFEALLAAAGERVPLQRALAQGGGSYEMATPLGLAVRYGDIEAVSALLAAGSDPYDVDGFGRSALSLLLARCRPSGLAGTVKETAITREKIAALLAAGVDPTRTDGQGNAPLGTARESCGDPEIVGLVEAAAERVSAEEQRK